MPPARKIEVRCPDVLLAEIDAAAAAAGQTRSAFVLDAVRARLAPRPLVEVLADATGDPVPVPSRRSVPARPPGGGRCTHPRANRRVLGYATLCGLCGARL